MVVRAMPQIVGDDLLNIQDQVTTTQIILSGVFDKELKELRSLKQDITQRQGTIDTVKKAEQVKTEADSYAQNIRKQAEDILQKANSAKAEAQSRLDAATAKEKVITVDLVNRENQLQQDIKNLSDRESAIKIKADGQDQDLKTREAKLKADQEKLSSDRETFQTEQANFQAKVNAIMGKA